ncbi:LysR family transcriptional regulator [Pseudarthrobacter sp. PS3-L1]|uniref:LysR family transcriptional regulator n=1 Tax=Pseudarthrobacter sp. PS3-L1 TaxID=3046207 RepID=UPI0024BB8B5D|nr:LysR family transcriptional regulator [Pseudarthrobacter sp. PS3-L1]MDJ0319913.1 LysR family transcriptional regulator [Pseudarthrobacter sp. PS3-L1]
MDVEVRHLRAFVAVAEEESFTYAALRLLITQPALSRTVQQLESILGVQLIRRTSKSFELTEPGTLFLDHAKSTLASLDRGVAAARGNTTVTLGFSWLLPTPWAQEMARYLQENAGLGVSFSRVDAPVQPLVRGDVDAAVLRSPVPRELLDKPRTIKLFQEPRVLVCSHRSPLAVGNPVLWEDVPRRPLVINIINGTTTPGLWPDITPEIVETQSYDEWIETVASDRGVGVVPDIARTRGIHPGIVFVPLIGAPPITVWLNVADHVSDDRARSILDSARLARTP